MSQLSERKAKILRAVVVEYLFGSEPVASELIASKYELGVRGATIRNELAEITELGLLEQPHTSAGRIPSTGGYRYYVDHLLQRSELTGDAKGKLKGAATDEETFREIITESTRALSRLTRLLAAASTMRDTAVTVRGVMLTALGPEKALLIVILQNGLVENRVVEVPDGMSLEDVGQTNEIFSRTLPGKTLKEVSTLKATATGNPGVDRVYKTCATTLRTMAKDLTRGHFFAEGEEYILAQPEFQRSPDGLEAMVRSIEDEDALRVAVNSSTGTIPDISIGQENREQRLHPLTVIRQTFFVGSSEAGTLALIGPVRMDYDRNVVLLEYAAAAISETLTWLMS